MNKPDKTLTCRPHCNTREVIGSMAAIYAERPSGAGCRKLIVGFKKRIMNSKIVYFIHKSVNKTVNDRMVKG